MIKKIVVLSAMFLLFSSVAFCDVSVKADVDKAKVTTDDNITYKVTIINSGKIAPKIKFPKFEGFKVVSQAQSSTISFVKSKVETMLVFAYILAPLSTGKYIIQPTEVLDNKTYKSDSFEIEVSQGKNPVENPRPMPGFRKNLPFEAPDNSEKINL